MPKVRTKFGSSLWVIRDLVPLELLSLKDIPEPIYLLVRDRENAEREIRNLFGSCRVPIKSLVALLSAASGIGNTVCPVATITPNVIGDSKPDSFCPHLGTSEQLRYSGMNEADCQLF